MVLFADFTLTLLLQTSVLNMASKMILVFIAAFFVLKLASALPDSAGIVEMTNGLAYGGIPYGSVSGMVASYGKPNPRQIPSYVTSNTHHTSDLVFPQASKRAVFPASRGPAGAAPAVQIFSHPGVVAPGVVGMIHQVGYQ